MKQNILSLIFAIKTFLIAERKQAKKKIWFAITGFVVFWIPLLKARRFDGKVCLKNGLYQDFSWYDIQKFRNSCLLELLPQFHALEQGANMFKTYSKLIRKLQE